MPPSPSFSFPSLPIQTVTEIQIHTYHCLCTTHLLTTPYALSSLPHRAPPSLDNAIILPLPDLKYPSDENNTTDDHDPTDKIDNLEIPSQEEVITGKGTREVYLPSLLAPAMRLVRKIIVVRREDGFEKRRVWRCGRCGVGVGYEIVKEEDGRGRVIYLLEGGLRETGELGG